MEKYDFEVPAMYGDHHVTEVRSILSAMPGVEDVYASSAFQIVQVTFDPSQITADAIKVALDKAGYTSDPEIPEEIGAAAYSHTGDGVFLRHTAAYAQVDKTVSFAQITPFSGRALWPCPGMGIVKIEPPKED